MRVTVFKNIFDTTDPLHMDVLEVLKRIKDGNSKDVINLIRTSKDKDEAQQIKKRLPSICFSGRFSKRQAEFLLEHSGLICLDIDNLAADVLQAVKIEICKDPHVFACFISPSGNGLKVIIKIHPDKSEHKSQFLALEKHFNIVLKQWNAVIDKSGKDVGRVCYESYDDELFYHDDSEIWIELLDEEQEIKEVTDHDLVINKLQKWIDNQEQYLKGNRNQFLFKFASALCRYGVGEMRTLSYLSENYRDFPFTELKTTVKSAYKSNDFGSQVFTETELRSRITTIKGEREREVTAFWSINDRGKVVIDPKLFLNFISANGFGIYRETDGGSSWSFIKVTNMIVDVVDVMDIKQYILNYVEKHAPEPVFTELQMRNRYFENTFLNALPVLPVEQVKDNAESIYIFFESFYYEIFSHRMERHDYIDLKGRHIWRSQISKKQMTDFVDYTQHDFNVFVTNVTGGDVDRYNQSKAALGYMMHTYKKRRLAKLIYSCDQSSGELDGMANGGTGKNLFFEALKYVRAVVDIDGKDFDKKDKFKFQTIADDTQIISIDDYEGDIKELFTRVTGHFEIEKKGQDKTIKPFDHAPKIMVSSNTSPKGYSSSFSRRMHLIEFADHYSEVHTPADEFGDRDFFSDDWTQADFNCLYSFMFSCAQEYLRNGLAKVLPSDDQKYKQAVKNTGMDFADYMGNIEIDEWRSGRDVYDSFIKQSSEPVTIMAFYSSLRKLCAIYNWKLDVRGTGIFKEIKIIK